MKNKIQLIFIILCFFVLVIPIVCFNKTGTVSKKENRALALRPYLIKDNRINKNIFSEYDTYFTDRFGGRQNLISLNHELNTILHSSSVLVNDKALSGKNGWYFYIYKGDGDNLSDFNKTNLLNEEQLQSFKQNVVNTLTWCKDNNIPVIFLICPNKHDIYAENYIIPRPEGITRADQMIQVFKEAGANYVFSRDAILKEKANFDYPLYYETDTHWNPVGAYIEFKELKQEIQKIFSNVNFPEIEYRTEIGYSMTSGDILPMLRISQSPSTLPVLLPATKQNSDYYTYLQNEDRKGVHTIGADKSLPRALIYRDSFFSALEPFTSPLFSEAEYRWNHFTDNDKEYVLQYKPDLLIIESVERSSVNMVNCK